MIQLPSKHFSKLMIWWCVLVQMQFPPTTIHEVFWHQDNIQWSSESDCTLLLLGRWNLRDEQFCCSFSFIKFLCYIWTMLGLTKTIPDWSYTIFIFHFFISLCLLSRRIEQPQQLPGFVNILSFIKLSIITVSNTMLADWHASDWMCFR